MNGLRRLGRATLVGVTVAVPLTLLAFVVRSKANAVIDLDVAAIASATAYTRERPGLTTFLLGWEWTTQPSRVYLVAGLVCGWAWRARGLTGRAVWAFATMMVGWNLALVLKSVVQRARPVVEDPITRAPGWSFPSGHVANMTIAVTAMTVLLWPLLRSRAARIAVIAVGCALVLVTAGDRVWLGVHYPSDTVGGVLFGVGLVLASYAGYTGWRPPSPKGIA